MSSRARLAIFHGLFLRGHEDLHAIGEAEGWPEGAAWGVYRLRSLRADEDEVALALIHKPSALGDWTFEMGWARPTHDAHFTLQSVTMDPPHGSDQAQADELRSLIEVYGPALASPRQWHAVALVERDQGGKS